MEAVNKGYRRGTIGLQEGHRGCTVLPAFFHHNSTTTTVVFSISSSTTKKTVISGALAARRAAGAKPHIYRNWKSVHLVFHGYRQRQIARGRMASSEYGVRQHDGRLSMASMQPRFTVYMQKTGF